MSILTKNRILQKGDEFFDGAHWKAVPAKDHGIQILFTKYDKVRRPGEPDPKPQGNGKTNLAEPSRSPGTQGKADAEGDRTPRSGVAPAPGIPPVQADHPPIETQKVIASIHQELEKNLNPVPYAKPAPAPEPTEPEPEPPTPPPSVNLQGDLMFKKGHKHCQWLGRNGQFECVGLNMFKGNTGTIWITPFGKRGLGRCMIEFPVDEVPRIIDWLQKATKP